jgi:hypothetical protein
MHDIARRMAVASVASVAVVIAVLAALAQSGGQAAQTAGGLTAHLGVVPAQIVKGHQTLHGGTPKGPHEYHIVAAVFDAAGGGRVTDATVTAKVSGLGLSGPVTTLEPMDIASSRTYGAFVYLPGADLYTIRLTVTRPGGEQPAVMDFKYDHRRR